MELAFISTAKPLRGPTALRVRRLQRHGLCDSRRWNGQPAAATHRRKPSVRAKVFDTIFKQRRQRRGDVGGRHQAGNGSAFGFALLYLNGVIEGNRRRRRRESSGQRRGVAGGEQLWQAGRIILGGSFARPGARRAKGDTFPTTAAWARSVAGCNDENAFKTR